MQAREIVRGGNYPNVAALIHDNKDAYLKTENNVSWHVKDWE